MLPIMSEDALSPETMCSLALQHFTVQVFELNLLQTLRCEHLDRCLMFHSHIPPPSTAAAVVQVPCSRAHLEDSLVFCLTTRWSVQVLLPSAGDLSPLT